jgi:outer membrane lipoprotein-sorting protein
MQSHFVRHEAVDDQDTLVYDLTYKGVTGGSHFRIWVDPKNHITVKRDWFDGENHLKATFRYQEPREVAPGLWLPTRVEVKNGDGVVAAVTSMEDIQVGQGLSDSLFMIVR